MQVLSPAIKIQSRVPANMLWDRWVLDKKIHEARAKMKAENNKNTNDSVFVQDPHSA